MELNGFNDQKPILYDGENDFFSKKTLEYATDSGILNGIESLLKGLPDTVRSALTAGEIADLILSMITDLREKARRENE